MTSYFDQLYASMHSAIAYIRRLLLAFFVFLLTVESKFVLAEIYRCVSQNEIIFRQTPCAVDTDTRKCESEIAIYKKKIDKGKATSFDRVCFIKRKEEAESERLRNAEILEEQEAERRRTAYWAKKRLEEFEKEEKRREAIQNAVKLGKYYVEYIVPDRGGSYTVTYINKNGGTEQKRVFAPWINGFVANKGAKIYISAQGKSDSSFKTTVVIKVNGEIVRKSNSSGLYAVASTGGVL